MITTMLVDCGPLGEMEWTVSYKMVGKQCAVNWIKLGGERGFDISPYVSDDYIWDEVRPHCFNDWEECCIVAAESKEDERREERRFAA